jgi:PGF-pre-PGF domain-containing protein
MLMSYDVPDILFTEGRRHVKVKTGFLNSLISVLLIVLIVSGMIPGVASAAEDNNTEPEDNGNSTVVDLVIESLSFDPENPELGQEVDIITSVKNNGDGTSEPTNLTYYIDGSRIGDSQVPEIEAGQSEQFLFSWKPETEGTVEITAKVDEQDSVPETDENNNEKTQSLSIENTGLPDLVIDTFKYAKALQAGEHEDTEISVKNQGNAASGKTKLKLYIGENQVNEWDIPSLSPGENSGSFSSTWTPTSEGPLEIKAVVDEGDLVNESDEENNQKADTITVAQQFLPDLIVEDILPEQGDSQVGKPLNITLKIKNQGTVPSAEVVAKYYINDIADNDSIPIPSLSQGAGADVSFSLTPDKGGPMEVKVVVDSDAAIPESNETNNQLIKVINVKGLLPDLKIESISLNPESPKPGENVTFTVTIKNGGPGDASSNELKYNINGTNEIYSGKIPVSALSAGNTTSGTFSWTPGNEGQIEIKAIVDVNGVVPEAEETNNELIKTATISKETASSNSGSGSSSSGSSHSSSGGSSGGGGAGGSPELAKNVEVKELSQAFVTSGKPVKFDFPKNATCVVYVSFDSKKTAGKTTTIAEQLKGKSSLVSGLPEGEVYKYFNIWVGTGGFATSKNIENPVVCFKVEKSWLQDKNIDQTSITLNRYSDKKWSQLPVKLLKEDNKYLYFTAETPEFSFFAITENTAGEKNIQGTKGEGSIQETLINWNSEVKESNLNGSAKESGLIKNPMGKAKILMAISLPLFMILVEYFILKKKI